jgi:pSer/pThr/pTyr-binding forkhead associated (FHA) protein
VSRRHAAVVRRDGRHFLQDLESTNGIFHRGVQVDNERIEEGDVFTLGNTELRFTYLLERTG